MVSFSQFVAAVQTNPFLALVMVLVIGTIFVNGATDAANAIAEPVGTRAIGVNQAIVMSVICNFVGLIGMTLISTAGQHHERHGRLWRRHARRPYRSGRCKPWVL